MILLGFPKNVSYKGTYDTSSGQVPSLSSYKREFSDRNNLPSSRVCNSEIPLLVLPSSSQFSISGRRKEGSDPWKQSFS